MNRRIFNKPCRAGFQDAQAPIGEDYWRYGITENRTELSARRLTPEDLFAEPVRELFKI